MSSISIPLKKPFYILALFSITCCTTPYFGYSKTDWKNLSKKERMTIKAEYKNIISAQREQKHTDLIDARKQSIISLGVDKQ